MSDFDYSVLFADKGERETKRRGAVKDVGGDVTCKPAALKVNYGAQVYGHASTRKEIAQFLKPHLPAKESTLFAIYSAPLRSQIDILFGLRDAIGVESFERVIVSTYSISQGMDDLKKLSFQKIALQLDIVYCDLASQEFGDDFIELAKLAKTGYNIRLTGAKNHSKVITARAGDLCFSIEGSSNIRKAYCIEVNLISTSKDVCAFHESYFDALLPEEG